MSREWISQNWPAGINSKIVMIYATILLLVVASFYLVSWRMIILRDCYFFGCSLKLNTNSVYIWLPLLEDCFEIIIIFVRLVLAN
jgi:hypothetical protein